jgi:ADP-ribose pyrophosphatase
MSDSYTTLNSKTVFQGLVFEIRRDEVSFPSGVKAQRDVVQHPGAVVILPVHQQNKSLVMIKQYRHAVGESIYEFPAGTLEECEDPVLCAKREITEEIGYGAEEMIPMGTLLPAPGFCNELQHLFLARGLFPESTEGDEDEIIEVEEISLLDFEELIVSNRMLDAKSIAIYARAKLMGLLDNV